MEKFIGSIKFLSENKDLALVHEVPMVQDLILNRQFGQVVETPGGDIVNVLETELYTATGGEVALTYVLTPKVVPSTVQLTLGESTEILAQDFPVASYGGRLLMAEAGINFTYDGEELTTSAGTVYTNSQGIILGSIVSKDYSGALSQVNYVTGDCEIKLIDNPEVDDAFTLNYTSTYTTSGGETEFDFSVAGFVKEGSLKIVEGSNPFVLGRDYPVGTKAGRDAIKAAGIDFYFDGEKLVTSTGSVEVLVTEGVILGSAIDNDLSVPLLATVNYYTGSVKVHLNRPVAENEFLTCIYERNVIPHDPDSYQLKLIKLDYEEFKDKDLSQIEKTGYAIYSYADAEAKVVKPVGRFSE